MAKAIRIATVGGPDVMEYVNIDVGIPGTGQAVVRQMACGLNYVDVNFRSGAMPLPLPGYLGMEGAGIVEEIGPGVNHIKPGDRVAYAGGPPGAYAEVRVMPALVLVKLPDAISFETGAAMMMQGLTAQYLLQRTVPLHSGNTILFHAAAGGVGLIACQWARAMGVNVIGTVGSDEKAILAKSFGCDHIINYAVENFAERVREITDGKGVQVVYDSIGKDTFNKSLACLSPFGMMVSFGAASGPVPPFNLNDLGSLYIVKPTLFSHIARRDVLESMATNLFTMVESGTIKIEIKQRYALEDVAQAHRDLEARLTTGSTILLP